jgi:pimeloyl-ACP methyl ester carboxylesterase
MGAKTAMTLALKYPSLVKLLVSVDNAPVDAALLSDFPRYVRTMKEIETTGISKQSEADALLQNVEKDISIRQFLLTNLVRDPESKTLKWRIALDTLAKSLDAMGDFELLPDRYRYKKPTLFIRGNYSKYVTDEMIPLIGRFFPRFQIKDIDAGHWVQAEKPAEFREILTRFILDEEVCVMLPVI